jgi:hypothetical protein
MKRTITITALAVLALTGCRDIAGSGDGQPAPVATAKTTAATAAKTTAAADPCQPDDGPPGVLAALSVSTLADRDRVVFAFHGRTVPDVTTTYVDRITEDPSDRPVPLLGSTFLSVVFHGGRLDTAPIESDPAKVVRYEGPTRLTPRYPVLRELAASGDFEAVLSFGLGLAHRATVRTTAPTGKGCVILDLIR